MDANQNSDIHMSNDQNSNASMSGEEANQCSRRHSLYTQLAHQTGPTPNRAKNCVICLDDMGADEECLSHADGRCLNAWHTECIQLELQASELRSGRARCPNCRTELTHLSPTPEEARTGSQSETQAGSRTRPPTDAWQAPRRWATHFHDNLHPDSQPQRRTRADENRRQRIRPNIVTAAERAFLIEVESSLHLSDEEYYRYLLDGGAARLSFLLAIIQPGGPRL